MKIEHHPQLASPAQARIVAQSNGPVYVPSEDPARAYVVYPSTGAMARGSLLNIADQALSKVVLGSVDRMMQPQAQPAQAGAYPQQQAGGMPQQGPAQAMAMPQQLPGAAGVGNEGPVMLRPWSERNQPVAGTDNSYNAPVQAAPVQQIPAGDAAFVF
ncbi:hypothetical protein [Stenotrophomonas maltophilia]|uniref:hypothetical protein n=1 Tax=Stenotrophomonas maltophilia TaxID=40324 RepID=UPI001F53D1FA|nr:hypothetical protein [Stenotrophomonas maltophilia]